MDTNSLGGFMDSQQVTKEAELNVFARFFGTILRDLKHHNLRHGRQTEVQSPYAQETTIAFIDHIR